MLFRSRTDVLKAVLLGCFGAEVLRRPGQYGRFRERGRRYLGDGLAGERKTPVSSSSSGARTRGLTGDCFSCAVHLARNWRGDTFSKASRSFDRIVKLAASVARRQLESREERRGSRRTQVRDDGADPGGGDGV